MKRQYKYFFSKEARNKNEQKRKLDIVSCLWKQNKITDTGRYRVEKFSALLSEVQAEKFDCHKEL